MVSYKLEDVLDLIRNGNYHEFRRFVNSAWPGTLSDDEINNGCRLKSEALHNIRDEREFRSRASKGFFIFHIPRMWDKFSSLDKPAEDGDVPMGGTGGTDGGEESGGGGGNGRTEQEYLDLQAAKVAAEQSLSQERVKNQAVSDSLDQLKRDFDDYKLQHPAGGGVSAGDVVSKAEYEVLVKQLKDLNILKDKLQAE